MFFLRNIAKVENMDTKIIILAIPVIFFYIDTINATNGCQPFKIKKTYLNKRLISHALGEIIVSGHHQCARECMSLKACKSMDYYNEENKCKLNDVDSISVDSAEFERKSGSIFSDITEWPSEMIGECSSRPCSEKQKCYSTYGKYTCIDIECDKDTVIPNGALELESEGERLLGDTAVVKCHTDFFSVKEKVLCTMTGQWETASCFEATNVALGKDTHSSSTHSSFYPESAVDGRRDTFFHSDKEQSPWWLVDLGSLYLIFNVTVYNTVDCCWERANGLELKLGGSLGHMEEIGRIESFSDLSRTFHPYEGTVARYVKLTLSIGTSDTLHLAEIEVIGKPA